MKEGKEKTNTKVVTSPRPNVKPAPQSCVENAIKDLKNAFLFKYLKDLKQNKYNLKKSGLYLGIIKEHTEALIQILEEDYEIK